MPKGKRFKKPLRAWGTLDIETSEGDRLSALHQHLSLTLVHHSVVPSIHLLQANRVATVCLSLVL